MTSTRDAAISQQVVWKSPALRDYAVALLRAWLDRRAHGAVEYAADDVPDRYRQAGGTPGNVAHMLVQAHIVEPVYAAPGQIKRRKSIRESRKDAWINVYRFVSVPIVQEWLRRNDPGYREGQQSFSDKLTLHPGNGTATTDFGASVQAGCRAECATARPVADSAERRSPVANVKATPDESNRHLDLSAELFELGTTMNRVLARGMGAI